jgi:hypothetical protein
VRAAFNQTSETVRSLRSGVAHRSGRRSGIDLIAAELCAGSGTLE